LVECNIPKQSRYERCQAPELLCGSLCGPRAKSWSPCPKGCCFFSFDAKKSFRPALSKPHPVAGSNINRVSLELHGAARSAAPCQVSVWRVFMYGTLVS